MTVESQGGVRDPQLRVGTAQRERAIEVIREAAADGRLDFDELEARVPRALAAVTRGDLALLLRDLVPSADLDAVLGNTAAVGEGVGFRWEEPLLIQAKGDSILVCGVWDVPPFIEVQVTSWGAKLNFTQARPLAKLIDLVLVGGGWGSVALVVPEGWGVDTQGLQSDGQSTVTSKVPTRPAPGMPRIVVRGRTTGNMQARHPSSFDLWQARRKGDRLPQLGR